MLSEEIDLKIMLELSRLIRDTPIVSGGFFLTQPGWLQKAQEIRDSLTRKSHWDYKTALMSMAATCIVELHYLENNHLEKAVGPNDTGKGW